MQAGELCGAKPEGATAQSQSTRVCRLVQSTGVTPPPCALGAKGAVSLITLAVICFFEISDGCSNTGGGRRLSVSLRLNPRSDYPWARI